MEILGYLASIFIGITLGLIGAGGGILSVPILVYLFGIKPDNATAYSLFIVGITAGIGAIRYYRQGLIKTSIAFNFVIPSIISLLITRKFLMPNLPEVIFQGHSFLLSKSVLIMGFFALAMIVSSFSMITDRKYNINIETYSSAKLILLGLIVGIVTGFLGAGGGFIIVPALVLFAGLEMKTAVGTSLLIICINTLIGFTGDLLTNVELDIKLLVLITFFALIGMFIGMWLSNKLSGKTLKPIFGWFILLMGIYILLKEFLIN
jgi:uncharacterized membrane protein YfcA